MKKNRMTLVRAFGFSLAMIGLCGFVYPLILTGAAQVLFPFQANGSLIEVQGKPIASALVGQDFTDERLFHGRPSAYRYNTYTAEEAAAGSGGGLASGSQNYAPSNPALTERIEKEVERFLAENPTIKRQEIPSDLVTASGSGLDPHISVEAARVQVDRIVANTGLSRTEIEALIDEAVEEKVLGIFGETKVNVVRLNLALARRLGMI